MLAGIHCRLLLKTQSQEENVTISPLIDETPTDTRIDFLTEVHVMVCLIVLDCAHGLILKTFTRLESYNTDPWALQGGGAQSRLRQLQTNVVTVNPECNLSCIKCTSSPQRVTIKPVISPKQKQNSKHDDTEKTPWRQKRPGYRVHIYTAVLPKQHGRCGIFGVCIFF